MAVPPTPADGTIARPRAAREVWVRVLVLAGAMAAGLVLQRLLLQHLDALETLAETDPIAARRQLATELRVGGLGLFGLTCVLGGWVIAVSVRAFRAAQFPPPGVSTWRVARIATGATARRQAIAGMVLGAVLVAASLAAGVLTWKIAATFLVCGRT